MDRFACHSSRPSGFVVYEALHIDYFTIVHYLKGFDFLLESNVTFRMLTSKFTT